MPHHDLRQQHRLLGVDRTGFRVCDLGVGIWGLKFGELDVEGLVLRVEG